MAGQLDRAIADILEWTGRLPWAPAFLLLTITRSCARRLNKTGARRAGMTPIVLTVP